MSVFYLQCRLIAKVLNTVTGACGVGAALAAVLPKPVLSHLFLFVSVNAVDLLRALACFYYDYSSG